MWSRFCSLSCLCDDVADKRCSDALQKSIERKVIGISLVAFSDRQESSYDFGETGDNETATEDNDTTTETEVEISTHSEEETNETEPTSVDEENETTTEENGEAEETTTADEESEATSTNEEETTSDVAEAETTTGNGEIETTMTEETTTAYEGTETTTGNGEEATSANEVATTTVSEKDETTTAGASESAAAAALEEETTTLVPTPSTTLNITNCCTGNEWEERIRTFLFSDVTGTRRYKRCLNGIFFKTPEKGVYNDNQCCPSGNWEKVEFPPTNVTSFFRDHLYQCSGIKFFTILYYNHN